jgi:hypothetical protein
VFWALQKTKKGDTSNLLDCVEFMKSLCEKGHILWHLQRKQCLSSAKVPFKITSVGYDDVKGKGTPHHLELLQKWGEIASTF